jgi:hypothetical protein
MSASTEVRRSVRVARAYDRGALSRVAQDVQDRARWSAERTAPGRRVRADHGSGCKVAVTVEEQAGGEPETVLRRPGDEDRR